MYPCTPDCAIQYLSERGSQLHGRAGMMMKTRALLSTYQFVAMFLTKNQILIALTLDSGLVISINKTLMTYEKYKLSIYLILETGEPIHSGNYN